MEIESRLSDAIADSFTSAELKRFVAYKLGDNLEQIVSVNGTLADMSCQLVSEYARRGQVRKLLLALVAERPASSAILNLLTDYFDRYPLPPDRRKMTDKPESTQQTQTGKLSEMYHSLDRRLLRVEIQIEQLPTTDQVRSMLAEYRSPASVATMSRGEWIIVIMLSLGGILGIISLGLLTLP